METMTSQVNTEQSPDIEDWFGRALEQPEPPLDHLIAAIEQVAKSGDRERAGELGDLALEKLSERLDRARAVRLLHILAGSREETPEFRKRCEQLLLRVFDDRDSQALLNGAGLAQRIPLRDVLRRLDVLLRLTPGTLVHEKTWKFGVIKGPDYLYGKIIVDFTQKAGHSMSMSYAADSLELIGDDHLTARQHRDAAAVEQMARENPAEIVKIALRSYGPMNVGALQELLTRDVFPGMEWKPFWDKARKALKADRWVDIPGKRTEPLRLLAKEKAYDEEWFSLFRLVRDCREILDRVVELEAELDVGSLSAEQRAIVGGRLHFGMQGAQGRNTQVLARLAIAAQRLGFGPEIESSGTVAALLNPSRFLDALGGVSSRDLRALLDLLSGSDAARTEEMLLTNLAQEPVNAVAETARYFEAAGKRERIVSRIRELIAERVAGPVVFCWLCRDLGNPIRPECISVPDLLIRAAECMGERVPGEMLRAQNQLRDMFEDREWLQNALKPTSDANRRDLIARIFSVNGWSISSRRSVMAAMLKLYPELADAVASEGRSATPARRVERWTSRRSYRDRVRQFKKLLEVEIPENSRDIGQARSYGDLRENAEYESAKHQQRILLQRKTDMEQELEEVKETDFSGLPTDRAGMGTMVKLVYPDGAGQEFAILGEWDRDESLGIISSKSKLAEVLQGHMVNDEILVPGTDGERPCRLVSVSGLSEAIRNWANEG